MREAADNPDATPGRALVAEETTLLPVRGRPGHRRLSMAMRDIDCQLANASGVVAEATHRANVAVTTVDG